MSIGSLDAAPIQLVSVICCLPGFNVTFWMSLHRSSSEQKWSFPLWNDCLVWCPPNLQVPSSRAGPWSGSPHLFCCRGCCVPRLRTPHLSVNSMKFHVCPLLCLPGVPSLPLAFLQTPWDVPPPPGRSDPSCRSLEGSSSVPSEIWLHLQISACSHSWF